MLSESFIKKKYFFFLFLTFLFAKTIHARPPANYQLDNLVRKNVHNISKDRFVFGISYFNAMRKKQNAIEARFEYRSLISWFNIKPLAGLTFTSSGAFFGMAGFYSDIFLGDDFIITPCFSAGYFNKGMGIDLAFEIEFRTQLEICYILQNDARIGISFCHMSNGNFGRSNPGAESFSFIYSLPFD